MSIYVDELKPPSKEDGLPESFAHCHLIADSKDELHHFAKRLGLKKAWFRNHHQYPHYILTEGKRDLAVKRGANEVTWFGDWL